MKKKRCPFCGASDKWLIVVQSEVGHLFWVMCKDCRTHGPVGVFEDEAVNRWNDRWKNRKED